MKITIQIGQLSTDVEVEDGAKNENLDDPTEPEKRRRARNDAAVRRAIAALYEAADVCDEVAKQRFADGLTPCGVCSSWRRHHPDCPAGKMWAGRPT